MAVDNSSVYKFAGNIITLKQSELKINTPTKYYIGNHPGGADPSPNTLSKLEESSPLNYEIKQFTQRFDIAGETINLYTEQTFIYINDRNQICINTIPTNIDFRFTKYVVFMNNIPFNDIYIKIENDKKYKPVFLIEDDEYEPILLKAAKK